MNAFFVVKTKFYRRNGDMKNGYFLPWKAVDSYREKVSML